MKELAGSSKLLNRIKQNEGYAGISANPIGTSECGTYVGHGSFNTISKIFDSAGVTREMAGDLYGKEIVVGYGHMLKGKSLHSYFSNYKVRREYDNMGCARAEVLLRHDIGSHKDRAIELAYSKGVNYHILSQSKKDTLIEMTFQLGPTGFGKFNKFWHHARNGDWNKASKEIKNSKLYKQATGRTEQYIENIQLFRDVPFTPDQAFNPLGVILLWQIMKSKIRSLTLR